MLSGIVLYGMFKVPDYLDAFLVFFKNNIFGFTSDIDNLIALLKVATYWLIFGLILHLISRGIWVGMVGLSYVFPTGIDRNKLKFHDRFKSYSENIPPFQKIVINLEKLCSSIFSTSFMLFMCIIGGYLFLFLFVALPFFIFFLLVDSRFDSQWISNFQYYVWIILIIGFIGFIDFLTLGYFKRFSWFAKFYYPLYRILNVVTLARFYRPIYYGIVTNYSRWKISIFLILFTVITIYQINSTAFGGFPNNRLSRIDLWHRNSDTNAFQGYYDDQNEENFSYQAHIPSDIINGNTLRLFVVANVDREDSMRKFVSYDSLLQIHPDTGRQFIDIHTIRSFYEIYLNDSLISPLDWKFHYKVRTRQRGYLTYIDITDLPVGLHEVRVKGPSAMFSFDWARISFFREISDNGRMLTPVGRKEEKDDYLKIKPILPK